MSWHQKLLPPKIKREAGSPKKVVPEGLWSKCDSCEAVLYRADLEKNLYVCPKCSHHNRISARERLDSLLDREGRYEVGAEVVPVVKIDGRIIGNGRPGPITKKLMVRYAALTKVSGEPIYP